MTTRTDTSPLGYKPEEPQALTEDRRDQNLPFHPRSQEERCQFSRDDVANIRETLGMEEDGRCPLPGHHGVAFLEPEEGDDVRLVCDCNGRSAAWDHRGDWRSWYSQHLGDAYHAVRTGRVLGRGAKLSKGMRFVWWLLLCGDAGVLRPTPVALPELPTDAPDLHQRARVFYARLSGLRIAVGGELEMPFPDRLVAAYFDVDRNDSRAAIDALRDHGIIVVTGRARERGPYLFLPGDAR